MIRLDGVTIRAGAFGVTDVNMDVPAGAYAVLMGRTGCGKTTILEALCGLRRVEAGRIEVGGRDVTRLKVSERGIGYVPQDRALFSTMSVREHLAFALTVRKAHREEVAARVAELSELLKVEDLLDRGVRNLSGGEQQRVALGRALAHRPAVLLLDEPLSALDDETRGQMTELLRTISRETGVTVLHVTHSLSEAERLAQRLFVLHNGRVEMRKAEG
jgi:ABC-type sugar transport system ATPase subunit